MTDSVLTALLLMGQGMAGIFVVLGVIALLVLLMQRIDRRTAKKKK